MGGHLVECWWNAGGMHGESIEAGADQLVRPVVLQ